MKKYLLTAALAIAIGGSFTSCHDDNFSGTAIDQKVEAYEEAFVDAFGQPDPNHTWGFAGINEAITRGENANANEWADPDKAYGGLLVPPPLTDAQIAVVKKYFQTVQNPTYEDPHWTNYFMQQVYKGYTNPMTGTDPKTGKPYSPECYKAADGNTIIYASNNMDHLAAIDESKNFVDHINNFNHGDCSVNNNVLDNGYHTNDNKFHSDKIMYMKESTTKSFGYYNSNGSVRRTEYTGLVSFQTIIDELGSEANCLNDGWNRSFMGFDFEQMVGPEIISQEKYTYKGKEYPVLVANQNMYCGIFYKKADGSDLNDTDLQQEGFIDNLLAEGYLPVSGGAGKKWVKVGGCADGYYSDWIVCLTEAKTSGNTLTAPDVYELVEGSITTGSTNYKIVEGAVAVESGRVLCEDLGSAKLSDIDFNDIVFDAVIVSEYRKLITTYYDANGNQIGDPEETIDFTMDNKTGYERKYALIRLLAAGGTIPASVAGIEVHNAFGGISTTVMINTTFDSGDVNGASIYNSESAVDLTNEDYGTKFYGYDYIYQIPINVRYGNESKQLTAMEGAAPHKILVPLGTPWAKERKVISEAYPQFTDYVKKPYTEFWNYPNVEKEKFLYENNKIKGLTVPENNIIEAERTVYNYTDTSSDPTVSRHLISATNKKMLIPGSNEHKLIDYNPEQPGYLCPETTTESALTVTLSGYANAQVGDIVRIYGVSADGWYVHTNIASSDIKSYTEDGYIDITVTEENLANIQSGLTISGEKFTVTYVTIRSNSDNNGGDNNGGEVNGGDDNNGGDNNGGDNNGGDDNGGDNNGGGDDTPSTNNEPVQVWPAISVGETSSATSISLSASDFNAAANGKVLRFYVSGANVSYGVQLGVWDANWSTFADIPANNTGWEKNGSFIYAKFNTTSVNAWNAEKQSIDLRLDDSMAAYLKDTSHSINVGYLSNISAIIRITIE